MANDLSAVTPKLLAQGLMALRQNAIMPRLVNRRYEELAGQKGSTIDVPIPSAIVAQAVTPANTPPSTADVVPTSVAISLDQWYEAPFYLTDKDQREAMEGIMPMQASEAIKALANNVDAYILALTHAAGGFYGFYGTPGSTPFATGVGDATGVRKVLNDQLAPLDDRHMVLGTDAEANALSLTAFADMSASGSLSVIQEAQLRRKFGFDWWMDQNIPIHTSGTGTGILVNNGAGYAVGTKTVAIGGGTGTLVAGDIVTFSGHTQTYIVTEAVADVSSGSLKIEPGLQAAVVDNEAITVKGSHTVNVAMHRDAIAFATRPLEADAGGLGAIIRSAIDPISGLTLRLEITREHKRTRFSYDILYGAKVVRRELGARLAG